MPTTVTIDSVTTEDAAPTTAPNRISAISGKDTATVKFTPTTSDASPIKAWNVRVGGTGRSTGQKLAGQGGVCGIARCGAFYPLSRAQGVQISDVIAYSQMAGDADGDYTVNVYAISDTQGWG